MQKIGSQTIKFDTPITILETASIVGPKEAEGPLAQYFDKCLDDEFWGEKTWEKAESKIIKETVNSSIIKSKIPANKIDYCFAGDLLNQCISSSFRFKRTCRSFFWNIWSLFNLCRSFKFRFCFYRWGWSRKHNCNSL